MHSRISWPVFFAATLLACSPAPQDPDAQETRENVFQDQTDALEKARAVEDTLLEAEKKRREQIEDDGG